MEFSGLDRSIQIERLAEGRKFLEHMVGAPITTFVPPWNIYDLNTLRALEHLGFSVLSADTGGETTEDSELDFLPTTCGLPRLQDAVKAARVSSNAQPLIVVLFHDDDFKEVDEKRGNITYQEFSDLLSWLKSQEDIRLLSISQVATVVDDLSAKRLLLNKRLRSLYGLLPPLFREEESMVLYRESTVSPAKALLMVVGFYIAIISLGAPLSLIVGRVVFPRYPLVMRIATAGSIAISTVLLVYAFRDLRIHLGGMLVCSCVVGVSLGLCLSFLHLKESHWLRHLRPSK
ncbi:MAG: hypothetical protein HOC20_05865 [Chloroflexi bacterium]|jgi:hypothetical protein|nr:hypothetical protein [Chloroflexota bacterium]